MSRAGLGWLVVAGVGFCMPSASAGRGDGELPGPAVGRRDPARLTQQATCVECHPVQAEQWARSGHAQAFRSETFERALAQEPLPFCRGCHAPEADPRLPTPDAAAELGVGCVSCHVVDDEILSGPASGEPRSAPHPVRRDPRFATADACANCHEFAFADTQRRHRPELMQSTVSEHRRSPFSEVSCAQCHMPARHGHRDHTFAASRDPELLRGALRTEAHWSGPCEVELSLTAIGVGHAFPTGDLMRRLEVKVETADGWHSERYLARHWGASRPLGTTVRVEISDDRVGPDPTPRRVRFALPPPQCGQTLVWSVRYQRIQEVHSGREATAMVVGDVLLNHGELASGSPTEMR